MKYNMSSDFISLGSEPLSWGWFEPPNGWACSRRPSGRPRLQSSRTGPRFLRALMLTLGVLRAVGYVERLGGIYRRPANPDGAQERLPELETFERTGEVLDHIDRPAGGSCCWTLGEWQTTRL